jgi:hypothetical protein
MLESEAHLLKFVDCNSVSRKAHMTIHSDDSCNPINVRLQTTVRADIFLR